MIWLTKVGPITLLELFYFVASYQYHEIIINAHVKWDTSAMDARVQVVLIFPYITSCC